MIKHKVFDKNSTKCIINSKNIDKAFKKLYYTNGGKYDNIFEIKKI